MIRKTIAGLIVVAAALIANPFNHADAADGPGTQARQCVNTARTARSSAQDTFRGAIGAARNLEPGARQAAVLTAITAFRNSAQAANNAFGNCIRGIDRTP